MNKYRTLAQHLHSLLNSSLQLKSLIYSPSFSLPIPSSYSLLSTCLNNISHFRAFKQTVEQSSNCQISSEYLFYVMLAEFINTGKIVGGGKIKRLIVGNVDRIPEEIGRGKARKINKGRVQIRVRAGVDSTDLERQARDPQIPNLFDMEYRQYSDLVKQHPDLLKKKGIVIQSKSSCLPPFVLFQGMLNQMSEFGKFDIIDCCAAPGNKTVQLAEYIGSHGSILAFEKNQRRAELLLRRIKFHQVQNIEVFNQDFLTAENKNPKFQNVKLVLADPSCSGSGMLVNIEKDTIGDSQTDESLDFQSYCQKRWQGLSETQKQRVINLQQFQVNILNKCASFSPLRIVYSTCSIYEQQNEQVVDLFLAQNKNYRIKKITGLPSVSRGFGPTGSKCLRVSPQSRCSDGFFVCLLKRIVL